MKVLRVLPVLLSVAGCAASARPPAPIPGRSAQPRPQHDEEAALATAPALLGRPPWRTEVDARGNLIHIQTGARIQFPASAGELVRTAVRIYDEQTNDVGVHYGGSLPESEPQCLYALSAYVYPATESLSDHLVAVRREFLARAQDAKASQHLLALDLVQKDAGVHDAYTATVEGLKSFEQISLYRRGDWFLKYRITYGPADRESCERRLFDAIAALQVRP